MLAATVAYHCRWLPEETIEALRQIEPFELYLLPAACRQCCAYWRGEREEAEEAPRGHFACYSWGDAYSVAQWLRLAPNQVVQVAGPWYGDNGWRQVVAIPERAARKLEDSWWRSRRLRVAGLSDDGTWR
jgi:hypothetical protein